MEIITLIENSSSDTSLAAEHGLSLIIKTQGKTLLFDMGASANFLHNAVALGMEITQVDAAIVSHAHYDHGGGLTHFLAANDAAKVYLKRGADGEFFSNIGAKLPLWLHGVFYPMVSHSPLFSRYIGLDHGLLETHATRINWVTEDTRIDPNILLLTKINGEMDRPAGNKFLLEKSGSRLIADSFDHEMVLVVEQPDGLVVFTGCGHRGILNMISAVDRACPGQRIKAVIGGFHLAYQPGRPGIAGERQDVEFIGSELLKTGAEMIYTGHCTGDEAYALLKGVLGGKLSRLTTGARFTI